MESHEYVPWQMRGFMTHARLRDWFRSKTSLSFRVRFQGGTYLQVEHQNPRRSHNAPWKPCQDHEEDERAVDESEHTHSVYATLSSDSGEPKTLKEALEGEAKYVNYRTHKFCKLTAEFYERKSNNKNKQKQKL